MAALRPVIRKEMEVISGDIEGAGKLWRPDPDQRTLSVLEVELGLNGGCFREGQAVHGGLHRTGMHLVEVSVDAKGIEEILRIAVSVADTLQTLKAIDFLSYLILVCDEMNYHREGCARIIDDFGHSPVATDLIDLPIEHHHLAIKVVERSDSEIAIVPQYLRRDGSFIDSFDECARSRDLKDRMHRHS